MPELTARLRLIADTRNFASNLQKAAQQGKSAMGGLNQQVGKTSGGLKKAEKASVGFFQSLKNNVGTQIKAGIMFASLYQALITFRQTIGAAGAELFLLDDALRKVQSISKDSDETIKGLNDSLLGAARTGKLYGQTAGEIATGMFEIVQAGFETGEAFDIAQVAAQAATTGFTEAAIAGKVITGAMLAFNMEADKARYVANILFQTVDTGVVKFEELASGLGVAMAPAAALGVPLEEIGAAISTMTVKGMPAARALTSLTRILMQFLDPSDQAQAAAESVGFSLSAQTIETYGLMGAMKKLNEATGGDIELLADMFDRQRALVGGFTLLNDNAVTYERTLQLMNGAQEDNGALERAWIERQKSLTVRLGLMKAAILGVVVPAWQPFTKSLALAADAVSSFIADESGLFAWLKRMSAITGLTAAWEDFTDAVRGLKGEGDDGKLSFMFTGLFVVLREVIPRVMELLVLLLRVGEWAVRNKPTLIAIALALGVMFVAAHPLLAVFQALLILVGYMNDNWDDMRVRVGGVTAGILLAVLALQMLWNSFKLSAVARFLFQGVTNEVGLFRTAIRNLSQAVIYLAEGMVTPVVRFFDEAARTAKGAATYVWNVADGLANILAKPVNIARKITVTTIRKTVETVEKGVAVTGKVAEGAGKGAGDIAVAIGKFDYTSIIAGVIRGLTQGLSAGIAFSMGPAIISGIGSAISAAAVGLAAALGISVVALAAIVVVVLVAAIVAGFLIYKYREQIWSALKSIYPVLKEFFTEQLPSWFKKNFTAKNIGTLLGYAAGILLAVLFPIPFLIIRFRKQIGAFLQAIPGVIGDLLGKLVTLMTADVGGKPVWKWFLVAIFPVLLVWEFREQIGDFLGKIAGFVAEIPGKIAELTGDAAGVIVGWLVDAAKWITKFVELTDEFIEDSVQTMIELPGKIAAWIGDNWKDILNWLIDVPRWIAKFVELTDEFIEDAAQIMIELPGKIAAWIGDNWKDILGALIDVPGWIAEFIRLIADFVSEAIPKIPGMFAELGSKIGEAMIDAIAAGFDVIGMLLGIAKKLWDKVPGPVKDFFGGAWEGFKKVWGLQSGVHNFVGGVALVGESGRELVHLPRGADVIPNGQTELLLRQPGGVTSDYSDETGGGRTAKKRAQRTEDVEEDSERPINVYVDQLTIEGDPREALESLGLQAMAAMGA